MNRSTQKNFIVSILIAAFVIQSASVVFSQVKSKKRGLAYGYLSEADMAALSGSLCWWYNWSYKPESGVSTVFENYMMDFVPMTWNGSFNESGIRNFYATHPNAKYLLGFNEPNFTTQANMTPSQAAAIWPRLEKIAQDYNLKLVSPAVNYADKPVTENGVTYTDPVAYLDAFFAACKDCKVDYIAVHNYMCYAGALADYIKKFKKYNRPIWLTEFACWDQPSITLDMQKGYMMGAIDYLESDTAVFRYSWFNGNRSGAYPYLDLFKPQSGQLTDLGKLYVTFNPIHDMAVYYAVPARIEAENYTTMSGINLEATKDVSGNANVGWIDANDWLEYNVDVPESGTYNVFFRISANASTSLALRENNTTLQTLQIASTGGWQNWKTLKTTLTLEAGKQTLQVFTPKGSFNLNWLEITTESSPSAVSEFDQAQVKLYPNPVTNRLILEPQHATGKLRVTITDVSGRLVFDTTYSGAALSYPIDFSTYRAGSYLIRLTTDNGVSNHLIVK